jgi:hypothetical protein
MEAAPASTVTSHIPSLTGSVLFEPSTHSPHVSLSVPPAAPEVGEGNLAVPACQSASVVVAADSAGHGCQPVVQERPEHNGLAGELTNSEDSKAITTAGVEVGSGIRAAIAPVAVENGNTAGAKQQSAGSVAGIGAESSCAEEAVATGCHAAQKQEQQDKPQQAGQEVPVPASEVLEAAAASPALPAAAAEARVKGTMQAGPVQLQQSGDACGAVAPGAACCNEDSLGQAAVELARSRVIRLSGVWEKDLQVRCLNRWDLPRREQ